MWPKLGLPTSTDTVVDDWGAMVVSRAWVPELLPSVQLTAVTVVGVVEGLSRSTCSDPAAGLIWVMTGVACSGVAPEVMVAWLTASSL